MKGKVLQENNILRCDTNQGFSRIEIFYDLSKLPAELVKIKRIVS